MQSLRKALGGHKPPEGLFLVRDRSQPALIPLGLAGLVVALAGHAARAWRHFPMFIGDHGWYLQVALRVSRGEALYRDVTWAYGPLPAHALAALFRWLGPDAGWASLLNTALTAAVLVLTYALLRELVCPGAALGLTAFAALAGPFVGGDLIRGHLYAYTQAIAWGAALSLVATVAALRWLRTGRVRWLLASAAAAAGACLCKPEFAVLAVGASAIALAAGRGRRAAGAARGGWLLTWAGLLLAAAAMQTAASGWGPLWRGYSGYDQLASGGVWGFPGAHASPRWLFSAGAAWAAALAVLAGRRWRRWHRPACAAAGLALSAALVAVAPDLVGLSGREALAALQTGAWRALRPAPAIALQWLAAVPGSALSFVLLWAAWRGRRSALPPAWWVLWAFALLANLRFTFTGYAAGLAVAPALAVFLTLRPPGPKADAPLPPNPGGERTPPEIGGPGGRSSAQALQAKKTWLALSALALVNLLAQPFSAGLAANATTTRLASALGPVTIVDYQSDQVRAVQAQVAGLAPADAPIFAPYWGAGWYLLTGRPNATPCDVVFGGLCATAAEAGQAQAALTARPPAAVILPAWLWHPERATATQARRAAAIRRGLSPWWDALARDYADATPDGVTEWVVLVKRET